MQIIPFPARPVVALRPTTPSVPFDAARAAFLADLAVAGRADWTRIKHDQELRRFAAYLAGRNWQRIITGEIRAYLRTRAHLGPSARAATICSLRVFYRWAAEHGYLAHSPVADLHGPARPKPTPKALTRAQIRQLIAYLRSLTGLRGRRDAALCVTALYTGLRAAELAALTWGSVDLDAGVLTIGLSKGNHGHAVALHTDLVAWLREYASAAQVADAPVFPRLDTGGAMRPGRVGKIVRRIAYQSGVPFHTHQLRHSFATWTLRESKDLFAVSKALGHKELKQTEIYIPAAVDIDQIAEAVAHLPGMDAW